MSDEGSVYGEHFASYKLYKLVLTSQDASREITVSIVSQISKQNHQRYNYVKRDYDDIMATVVIKP